MGVFITYSCIVGDEERIYHFADHPEELERIKEQRLAQVERRFADLMALPAEERLTSCAWAASELLIVRGAR